MASIKRFIVTAVVMVLAFSVIIGCGRAVVAESAESVMPPGVQVVAYDNNVDYMKLMIQCAEHNTDYSMMLGAIYEAQRNLKIEHMNLGEYNKTNYFVTLDGMLVQNQLIPGNTSYEKCYTEADAIMIAKLMYGEGRGTYSKTELSCIAWTVLNRVDAGYGTIAEVVTAPNQFAYSPRFPTVSDYKYDLVELATDVLDRWSMEKAGMTDVGRTLPSNYLYYGGDGKHNYFRTEWKGGTRWNYSLPSPYEN